MVAVATGGIGATAALDAIRQEFFHHVDRPGPTSLDLAAWEEVAWEYGQSYLTVSPHTLIQDLAADFVDAATSLGDCGDSMRPGMLRVSAQLAAVMAMTLPNAGQVRAARRWWATAREAADQSGDRTVRIWVRGEEGIHALYTSRPPQVALDLAGEALTIAGGQPITGKALACKAQALAALGLGGQARDTVRAIEPIFVRMPPSIVSDERTVYGWPECCLRHTESYVYSLIGDINAAMDAQQAALDLCPLTWCRSHALLRLHEALCMVRVGDMDAGCEQATRTISSLPLGGRGVMVAHTGQRILQLLPAAEQGRPAVFELVDVLRSNSH